MNIDIDTELRGLDLVLDLLYAAVEELHNEPYTTENILVKMALTSTIDMVQCVVETEKEEA